MGADFVFIECGGAGATRSSDAVCWRGPAGSGRIGEGSGRIRPDPSPTPQARPQLRRRAASVPFRLASLPRISCTDCLPHCLEAEPSTTLRAPAPWPLSNRAFVAPLRSARSRDLQGSIRSRAAPPSAAGWSLVLPAASLDAIHLTGLCGFDHCGHATHRQFNELQSRTIRIKLRV
jgi:hypothetical protein